PVAKPNNGSNRFGAPAKSLIASGSSWTAHFPCPMIPSSAERGRLQLTDSREGEVIGDIRHPKERSTDAPRPTGRVPLSLLVRLAPMPILKSEPDCFPPNLLDELEDEAPWWA